MTATAPRNLPSVRSTSDTALQVFFAWERWGNFINARPGDGQEIPYDAARLEVKVYPHALGEVRVLRFPKTRTHDHVNKTDTILYEWTARRVQFVGDDAAVCAPGNISLHPKGVFHHGETLTPGLAVEFAFEVDDPVPNPKPTFVPPEEAPWVDAAWWCDDSRLVDVDLVAGEALPGGATPYRRRTVKAGRYVVREVSLASGAAIWDPQATTGRLIVVLSGQVEVAGSDGPVVLGVEDNACFDTGSFAEYRALGEATVLEAIVS